MVQSLSFLSPVKFVRVPSPTAGESSDARSLSLLLLLVARPSLGLGLSSSSSKHADPLYTLLSSIVSHNLSALSYTLNKYALIARKDSKSRLWNHSQNISSRAIAAGIASEYHPTIAWVTMKFVRSGKNCKSPLDFLSPLLPPVSPFPVSFHPHVEDRRRFSLKSYCLLFCSVAGVFCFKN